MTIFSLTTLIFSNIFLSIFKMILLSLNNSYFQIEPTLYQAFRNTVLKLLNFFAQVIVNLLPPIPNTVKVILFHTQKYKLEFTRKKINCNHKCLRKSYIF